MEYNSNTSQIVKTYGKPRRTQLLGQNSVWHNDLTDDFDKCFGVEDVQQTTFISPEPTASVSMFKHQKHKKKNENRMSSISKWSMKSHSSSNSNKDCLTARKRNMDDCSFDNNTYKNNLWLKSTEKKKKDGNFRINCSSSSSKDLYKLNTNRSDIAGSSKDTLRSTKKFKSKFYRSRNQCSTPIQSSTYNTYQNKLNNKKKSKIQKNLGSAFDTQVSSNISNISKKSNYSHLNSSDSSTGINYQFNKFENSIIAGSHLSKKKIIKKNINTVSSTVNNGIKNRKVVSYKSKRHCIKKKEKSLSKESHSNWYRKVMNIIGDKETHSSKNLHNNEHRNEEIKTDQSLENHCFKSDTLVHDLKNVTIKPLEQQLSLTSFNLNNESFQSFKSIENSPLRNEFAHDLVSNCIISNKSNIVEDQINDMSQSHILTDYNTSDSYCNSLYQTFYEVDENKVIESIRSPNTIYTSFVGEESLCDKPKAVDCKPSQQNKIESSLSSIIKQNTLPSDSSCNLDLNSSIESCADSLDIKLVNILERCRIPNVYPNFNQSSLPVTNIDHKFNKQQSVCRESNSKSFMLQDVTNKFSNISLINEITHNDQSISNISRNSSSDSQSSHLGLEQNTVIYKQNCTDEFSKENVDNQNWFFDEKNIVPLITPNKCSLKEDSLKDNHLYESISSLTEEDITSDSTLNNYTKNTRIQDNSLIDLIDVSPIKYVQNATIKDQTTTSSNSSENLPITSKINAPRQKRYGTRFLNNFDVIEESFDINEFEVNNSSQKYVDHSQSKQFQQNIPAGFRLEPGKKWRRSIVIVRNFIDGHLDQTANFSQNITKGRKWSSTVDEVLRQQSLDTTVHQRSINQSNIFKSGISNTTQPFLQRNSIDLKNEIAKKYIFEVCNQQHPITFKSWLESKRRKNWMKVGEGVFGEVFSYSHKKNNNTVVKIIPIEGKDYINSEKQKMYYEVYTEILIASEFNKLLDKNGWNQTNSFCRLKNISCVQGKYPAHLINLWKDYNNNKGSDNDNPHILPDNQMFMILEMEDGGIDVERFVFNSAHQSLLAFLQIVFGLAVAEQQYDFEHRDLHIGNILVKKIPPSYKHISFKLDGETFTIPSNGVKITIIDFTLSRITHLNKSIYNDLAEDTELFTSDGDYQFEIYRLMREETNDQWALYKPKTNIYWLHYVLDKMLKSVHYKRTTTAVHKTGLQQLQKLKNSILSYDSAKSFAESGLVLNLIT